jgi:glycosyltransferase involved in cell wall biosynthesis
MNILQVPRRFTESSWGGTETVILETSKRLLKMGHHTEIVCPNALADRDAEIINGVKINRVPYFYPYWRLPEEAKQQLDNKGGNLFSFALMTVLKKYPALDLIHTHTGKRTGGIVRYVAKKRQIPYIVSLHGGIYDVPTEEAKTWTTPIKGAFEWGKVLGWWVGSRRVLDDAAAILCVGEPERCQVQRRFPQKNVFHLPNGVNPEHFARGDNLNFRYRHNISLQAYVILIVGRIDPQKNQLFAVRVLPSILLKEPKAHLVLIGHVTNESYYDQISRTVQKQGLENHVTLIPGLGTASSELVDAYHAANVFLLPSVHEPFGIVILEAWAAGLPVIASRVGGVPALVSDGQDGLLFEPDDEKAFIYLFSVLRKDRQWAYALATAGQTKAQESYRWEKITERLVRIYEEVICENSLRQ